TGALAAMEAYRALVTGSLAPAPDIPNDPTAKAPKPKQKPLPPPSIPLPKLSIGVDAGAGSAAAAAIVPDLEAAKHDLERAVFLDPKLFEAQRLLGELYMATANGDAKLIAKATG